MTTAAAWNLVGLVSFTTVVLAVITAALCRIPQPPRRWWSWRLFAILNATFWAAAAYVLVTVYVPDWVVTPMILLPIVVLVVLIGRALWRVRGEMAYDLHAWLEDYLEDNTLPGISADTVELSEPRP